MHLYCSHDDPLLALRPCLSKPRWHNLVLLVLALSLVRCCILWQVAVAVLLPIRLESCYQRLKRLLRWTGIDHDALKRAWIRWVLAHFATPGKPLILLIDWTMHTDRCRSLWVQLAAGGGRSLPIAFWLADNRFGGPGKQRAFEDTALRELRDRLPDGWLVLLMGDRGFGGRDRMRFVASLGWSFVFRITGDACCGVRELVPGHRGRRWRMRYARVDADPPAPGQRWFKEGVRYGRHRAVTVNLAANCLPAGPGKAAPAVWYLATNLPASEDAVALYAQRMQIEQSFRDYKSGLGLEREYTRRPSQRLEWLLFAVMVVAGRQTWQGRQSLPAAATEPTPTEPAVPTDAASPPPPNLPETDGRPRYRVVSDFRRGWHEALTELVRSDSAIRQTVAEIAAKAERMQQRPQVLKRRKPLPTKSRARTRPAVAA